MSLLGESSSTAEVAAELHLRAVAENGAGRPGPGSVLVIKGLGLLDVGPTSEPTGEETDATHALLIARLLATLAKSEVEMTGLDHGLTTMARAERWAATAERTGAADDGFRAFLSSQRGLILFRGGRFVEALADLDRAAAGISDETGLDKCRVLINRGALFVETGEIAQARNDLAQCLALARRFELQLVERITLHNLGCLEFIAGDLPLALRLIDQGMALDGATQAGIAYLDRSRILLAAGLQQDADDSLSAAAAQLSRDRSWQDVGEVELTRAESALLDGQTESARALAARARNRFRRHGNDRWRRQAELVLIQSDFRAGRSFARLLPRVRRLASELEADGFRASARTALLLSAELEERLGRPDAGEAMARQAGEPTRNDPITLRLHTRLVWARLHLSRGDRGPARRQLRLGQRELAAYQGRFGGIDLQTASAIHGLRLAELDLDVAITDGSPSAVFAAVERGRATSRRLRPVTPPRDDVAAELLAQLRRTVEDLRVKRGRSTSAAEIDADRQKVADLQQALRERSWQTGGTGSSGRTAATPDVRAALRAMDSTGVTYVNLRGDLFAVLTRPRGSTLHDLGVTAVPVELVRKVRADLDVLANTTVPATILGSVRGSLTRSLAALDEILITPLGISTERVLIMPNGSLLTTPWGMLPSLRGRPVEVAPSATAWLGAASRPSTGGVGVAVLAGPGLGRATEEAHAIGTIWPGSRVLTGEDADPAALRRALSSAAVVHVAAHGRHQADSPMFSSLQLTGGPLFAYELDPGAWTAEHVVLSACDLGRTTMRAGEESLGLTSALLHLGTRSVVSGLSRVNDAVAADVMVDYHRALASGTDAALALAQACAVETERPAPFVCFGSTWTVGR